MQNQETQPNTTSIDIQGFANLVRQKFPDGVSSDGRAYKDIPDRELADKVIEKYPVYRDKIKEYSEADSSSGMTPIKGTFDQFKYADKYKTGAGFEKGVKKGAARLGLGLGRTIGAPILKAEENVIDKITGSENVPTSISDAYNKGTEGYDQATQSVTPETPAEKAGATVFDIASAFAQPELAVESMGPKGLAMLAEKGLISPQSLQKLLPIVESKLGKLTAQGLKNFVEGAGYGAVQAEGQGEENVAKRALTTGLANAAIQPVASAIAKGNVINEAGNAAKSIKESVIDAVTNTTNEERALSNAIEAVNPELKGKNLVEAYKDVATGKRGVKPAGVLFSKQGVTPTNQTIKLGERLKDVLVHKDPLDNLTSIGKNLETAENQLTKALEGTPDIRYLADKDTLFTKLGDIKSQIPREFASIKDQKSVFDNVVDFADELVKEADDSLTGLRNARSKFDIQAKKEYPSAYKDGMIDTKTPAGRAIKLVRDTMNDHLYDTAPNGTEIKSLIGREADLFKARDIVAQNAAKQHGMDKIQRYLEKNPYAKRALQALGVAILGSTAYGAVSAAKN